MELWSSPRKVKLSRGGVESSEDNGSEDEIGTRKFWKGSLGKGKGLPPKKKAKATKKTRDEDSDNNDSYYNDKKRAHTNLRHEQKRANCQDQGTEENDKGSQNALNE